MIYLDAAATTLHKPPEVYRAMAQASRRMSSPGRGSYPASHLAEETAYRCRSEAAELFGVPSPEQVVFTFNATHGLNIAIKTLVHPGSRVVVSGYEHNAVTRPLYAIPGVEILVADAPLFQPEKAVEGFAEALTKGVDVAICNHVSNVFGTVQPIEEIAALCRRHHVPLIVDASQSAGVLPIELEAWGAAFVAMPGHKGLYGPQGTGLLLCHHPAVPLLEGGTGSASLRQEMPDFLPDQLEAGTHNMPGIAGLLEGIRFVRRTGCEAIAKQERMTAARAVQRLREVPGVRVFADDGFHAQTGVVSFTIEGRDCEEIGEALAQKGIAVRAGLQCAPLAHRTAGTLHTGTVRLSTSAFTTLAQVDHFAEVLRGIVRENGAL